MKNVSIPSWIVAIGENAFEGSGIGSINLSKNTKIEAISDGTFANCRNLKTIILPKGIKSIGNNAFENCIGLTDGRQIGEFSKLERIGAFAFSKTSLEEVIIPTNVTTIDQGAFMDCPLLENLTFDRFPAGTTDKVCKVIGNEAFAECTGLVNITFPIADENKANDSFEINYRAFSGCYSLANDIYFPKNIMKIGDEAFSYCGDSYTDWNRFQQGDSL